MKFLRAELHNHSTESDGALTTEQLTAYAAEKRFGVLALTDHNTVSGHAKVYQAIRRGGYNLSLLPGVEITTFYGHVLALGLVQMPDFTSLDPRSPEPFFAALRAAGARAVVDDDVAELIVDGFSDGACGNVQRTSRRIRHDDANGIGTGSRLREGRQRDRRKQRGRGRAAEQCATIDRNHFIFLLS